MRRIGLAIVMLVLAGACGGPEANDQATVTPTSTATATAAPSRTAETATATAEPTETPTGTAVATETGTPPGDTTETPSPSPAATTAGPTKTATPRPVATTPPATSTPVPPTATATTAATAIPALPQSALIELSGSRVFRFVPEHVEIGAGGSVTWKWVAGVHNVVGDGPINHPGVEQTPGYTYTAAFPAAGTYAFTCEIHPATMNGTVTVR